MEELLDKVPTPDTTPLDPKELEFFIERLAQILLMQIEDENNHEYEEDTCRLDKAV